MAIISECHSYQYLVRASFEKPVTVFDGSSWTEEKVHENQRFRIPDHHPWDSKATFADLGRRIRASVYLVTL
jgi:hypothetical protein